MNWTAPRRASPNHFIVQVITRYPFGSLLETEAYTCKKQVVLKDDFRLVKTYGHYCPIAHSLGLVGERWTLLVVRELLHGPKRYTDLADHLPGSGRTSWRCG